MSKAAVGFGCARKYDLVPYKLRTLQPESASSTLRPPSDFVARASVDCILQGLQPKSASSIVRPPSGFAARTCLDSFALVCSVRPPSGFRSMRKGRGRRIFVYLSGTTMYVHKTVL